MKKTNWTKELEKAKKGTVDQKLDVILEVLFGFMSGLQVD